MQEIQKMKTVKRRAGELNNQVGGDQTEEITEKMVHDFELAVQEAERLPSDPEQFAQNKVEQFIESNPLN